MSAKNHWENVYSEKTLVDTSWYQAVPTVSWQLMKEIGVAKDAAIIDVGGGDSMFVDFLLSQGYSNITVLDISEHAIERAKARLGSKAEQVEWIVSDILTFATDKKFDFWHDRAVLHFLTKDSEIDQYVAISRAHLNTNGKVIVGTFAESGPEKCSGMPVKRYAESSLGRLFATVFEKIKCLAESHLTPMGRYQDFVYCAFAG